MCPAEEIPPDVLRFIVEKIDTVPHLEALLLVWERPGVNWTQEQLARQLYVTPAVAQRITHGLIRRGWLKKGQAGSVAFNPGWDPDGTFMRNLASIYRRQLIAVTSLIHSNVSAGVRDFADAFNLKKE
ncbi:MAG: hypothetical protein ABI640_03900 [Gammaproteobacteria bacterium]